VAKPEDFTIVVGREARDSYEGTNVPGEFHSLTDALGTRQIAATLICIPPHSDFEQGTGHHHDELEELYLVTSGSLTMRFGNEIRTVSAGAIVRVGPGTVRSHRNEGDEPVELWAFSTISESDRGTKVDDFWEPSPASCRSTAET
jgi:mannose-6-phosphate isomerase-like protein (cupin superfamily)